jgi:mono/diheme cytochrome c family protein
MSILHERMPYHGLHHRSIWLWLLLLALLTLLLSATVAAQGAPTQRPAGVTDSSIAWGKALFDGSANCAVCHGVGGRGTDQGPDLADAIWLHGPGTYESIVSQVLHGVPARQSVGGEPMPIRGWTPMNQEDVRAVAAYIWSISHPPKPFKTRVGQAR